jgi:hypothetical protein
MATSKKPSTYSGAVLRMHRDERLATQTDPKVEAERHERFFLAAMASAKEHFDWIIANSAWVTLGHETFAAWWEARVMPVANGLGMRPTQDIAKAVIEKVREEESALPKAQRRTQQQIAAMVGLDRSALANRDGSRSLPRENSRQSDLDEPPADPLHTVPAAATAVNDFLNTQTSGLVDTSPVDESGEDHRRGNSGDAAQNDASTEGEEASKGDEVEDEANPSASDSAAKPEQGGTGVARPAPAPGRDFEFPDVDKLRQRPDLDQDAVEEYARKTAEHELAKWRDELTTAFVNFRKAFRAASAQDIYEKADDELINLIVNTHADIEEKWRAVAELKVEAAKSNVVQLRSVS